jgi:hypothetical protein
MTSAARGESFSVPSENHLVTVTQGYPTGEAPASRIGLGSRADRADGHASRDETPPRQSTPVIFSQDIAALPTEAERDQLR